ncbi:hypothetical protein VN97_g9681 [Penicillium thymicola]|uniref:USP domain-containing protein n=1 Tax=Penicillium thymicola TaxID=293382 RepID=A0AAI9TBI0_PENTH|nr:hypothetical protein VN97_g9681 [Penicillium thymicola]
MILHMPVFYNWLIWYKDHHAPKGHLCLLGSSEDGPSACPVCQLAEIAQGYWAGKTVTESWMPTFKALTHSLLQGWKPAGVDSEQDPAEYFDVLYAAIKKSTKPMMKEDVEDMLEVELIMVVRCDGENPCKPKYISRQQRFMMISLSGEEGDTLPEKPTLSDVIENHFGHEDDFDECADCGGSKTARDQIGSFPEILLVQLNRTSVTGEKIDTHVYLTEELNIETRFMDERWSNERKVVQYRLTSIVLHHGGDVTQGHYSIGVKGKGDEWSQANDIQILDWDPEGPEGNPNHLDTGYLFTYRRLPTNDEVQTPSEAEIPQTEPPPEHDTTEIDSVPLDGGDDGGVFSNFDSGLPEDPENPAPKGPVPELGFNIFDPKKLGKLLDVMVPKVVDSYIARSADARRNEWEKWANEWEKKRETAPTAPTALTALTAQAAKTSTSDIAIDSGIGADSNEDMVDWTQNRGRLRITLTQEAGTGPKVLDLEVQGMSYNRLKRKRGEKEKVDEEVEKKTSTFIKLKKKVQAKVKNYGKEKEKEEEKEKEVKGKKKKKKGKK